MPHEVAEALKTGELEEQSYDLKLDYSLLSCEAVLKVRRSHADKYFQSDKLEISFTEIVETSPG